MAKEIVKKGDKTIVVETDLAKAEGAAHQDEDMHAGTNAPDETSRGLSSKVTSTNENVEPKAKTKTKPKAKKTPEPKAKKPAFPSDGTINKYGFIGVGVDMIEAMGLKRAPKGQKGKLADNVPIEFSSYDPTTRTLKLKIL